MFSIVLCLSLIGQSEIILQNKAGDRWRISVDDRGELVQERLGNLTKIAQELPPELRSEPAYEFYAERVAKNLDPYLPESTVQHQITRSMAHQAVRLFGDNAFLHNPYRTLPHGNKTVELYRDEFYKEVKVMDKLQRRLKRVTDDVITRQLRGKE